MKHRVAEEPWALARACPAVSLLLHRQDSCQSRSRGHAHGEAAVRLPFASRGFTGASVLISSALRTVAFLTLIGNCPREDFNLPLKCEWIYPRWTFDFFRYV